MVKNAPHPPVRRPCGLLAMQIYDTTNVPVISDVVDALVPPSWSSRQEKAPRRGENLLPFQLSSRESNSSEVICRILPHIYLPAQILVLGGTCIQFHTGYVILLRPCLHLRKP